MPVNGKWYAPSTSVVLPDNKSIESVFPLTLAIHTVHIYDASKDPCRVTRVFALHLYIIVLTALQEILHQTDAGAGSLRNRQSPSQTRCPDGTDEGSVRAYFR